MVLFFLNRLQTKSTSPDWECTPKNRPTLCVCSYSNKQNKIPFLCWWRGKKDEVGYVIFMLRGWFPLRCSVESRKRLPTQINNAFNHYPLNTHVVKPIAIQLCLNIRGAVTLSTWRQSYSSTWKKSLHCVPTLALRASFTGRSRSSSSSKSLSDSQIDLKK